MGMYDAVPIAAPDDPTTLIQCTMEEGVVELTDYGQIPQATFRMTKPSLEPDPGDSDGIPTSVELDVSVRGSVPTNATFLLTPAETVTVLMELYEQSYRDPDPHPDLLKTPFLIPATKEEPAKVNILVLRWTTFKRWYKKHAEFNFIAITRRLVTFKMQEGARVFLHKLDEKLDELAAYDDCPFRLLTF